MKLWNVECIPLRGHHTGIPAFISTGNKVIDKFRGEKTFCLYQASCESIIEKKSLIVFSMKLKWVFITQVKDIVNEAWQKLKIDTSLNDIEEYWISAGLVTKYYGDTKDMKLVSRSMDVLKLQREEYLFGFTNYVWIQDCRHFQRKD